MKLLKMIRRITLFLLIFFLGIHVLGAVEVVPPGNRNVVQPPIPGSSAKRTREVGATYEEKYQKIYHLLQADGKLRQKIKRVARDYAIDPVHIAGAIVGEHTYNVGVLDQLQTYYIKGIAWAKQAVVFAWRGERVSQFVQRSQFDLCVDFEDSNQLWNCREEVWEAKFRGKRIEGKFYPDKRFSAVFFQPFFAGQTFGLGQLNPLTALMMSDRVHKVSGLPKLSADNGRQLYRTIIDPDTTLPYIAAIIRQSIEDYRNLAGFDIIKNPGITATLYNVGGSAKRARLLAAENKQKQSKGLAWRYPQENYYGWLVNAKLDELEKLFKQ